MKDVIKWRMEKVLWKGIGFLHKDKFLTYHFRPVYSRDILPEEKPEMTEKIAIVIQGPICCKKSFTLETVKLYKRIYPHTVIIVSTWNSIKEKEAEELIEAGAVLVLSDEKEVISPISTNYQIVNTLAGIKKAVEMGCSYILKTRADQRMYAPGIFSYLFAMFDLFPLPEGTKALGRIAALGHHTFKNRCYSISDMWLFGKAEDILLYFSCPQDNRGKEIIEEAESHREKPIVYSKYRVGEIYFASHYIEGLGNTLKWNINDSLNYYRDLFLIVDKEALDFYWPKYTNAEYRWRDYSDSSLLNEFNFKDWLMLQHSHMVKGEA